VLFVAEATGPGCGCDCRRHWLFPICANLAGWGADGGDGGTIVSGGNFHAELVAIAAAGIGAMSERRIALLTDASLSGLPPFLTRDPGLNSSFMIAHATAAPLASENKSLAHPVSVDSLPKSANQEDHVSMATFAARWLGRWRRTLQESPRSSCWR